MTTWDKCDDGKYRHVCRCENPCTSSASARMVYVYPEKNLRAYPGVIRRTQAWDNTYKIVLLWKEILITSKKISVLQEDVHKTNKPCMPI